MQDIAIESLRSLSGRLIGLGLMHSLWISLCAASAVALGFQLRPYLSHQSCYRILVTALLLVAAAPILVTALERACASRGLGTALKRAFPSAKLPGDIKSHPKLVASRFVP